jgi:periplasmic protein TonB
MYTIFIPSRISFTKLNSAFMEQKKRPSSDVYKKSSMHFNIGLIIALALVITAFEFKTFDKPFEIPFTPIEDGGEIAIIPPTVVMAPPPPPAPIPSPEVKPVDTEPTPELVVELPPVDVPVDGKDGERPPVSFEGLGGPAPEAIDYDAEFRIVETAPSYSYDFYGYIAKNIRYPREAERLGIEGRVVVEFVVEKDGSLSDVNILKGIGGGCDEEAMRVIKKAPKWNPGKQRGVPVKVRMSIPVMFKTSR